MITKWKVFNFKSVRKETELEFAPLTIFAGANSSGKSTFLQSILLVAQTLSHKVSSRSVVLNGAFTRLGQFDDLRSSDSGIDQILIGWSCKPEEAAYPDLFRTGEAMRLRSFYSRLGQSLSQVGCEIVFDAESTASQQEVAQVQPRLSSSQVNVVRRTVEGADESNALTVRREAQTGLGEAKLKWRNVIEDDDAVTRNSLSLDVNLDENSLAEIREELRSAEAVGCFLRHFLPRHLALGVDVRVENARLLVNILAGESIRARPRRIYRGHAESIPESVVELIVGFLQDADAKLATELNNALQSRRDVLEQGEMSIEAFHDALRSLSLGDRARIRDIFEEIDGLEERICEALTASREEDHLTVLPYRLPQGILEAIQYTDQFFATSVRYLGPLRDEPKALYPLAPSADPYDVGLKGEHTAAVLDLHKSSRVNYVPSSCFTSADAKARPVSRTLETAVMDWLKYLGVAETVRSIDRGKLGHELKVRISADREHFEDLTHVGVGVSQVLPILVAGLLAKPDTTLIFEQPELHLHPKVQTLLGDFFLSLTQLKKQCIVETHSEYLINRLRFRTAAAMDGNPWVEATKVYFVDRTEEGSIFREVEINEYGAILDWPEGFFDQSQDEAEAILRAAAKKRKQKRGK